MASSTLKLPGESLSNDTSKTIAGPGTHIHASHPTSSLLGFQSTSTAKTGGRISTVYSVNPPPNATQPRLPQVHDIVLGRVLRLQKNQAHLSILSLSSDQTSTPDSKSHYVSPAPSSEFTALIRVQDVRATEKDKVKIIDSFRPGDIVRAEIVSPGDERNFYCSTARNDLGVVFAVSDAGRRMVPRDWSSFWDPETGVVEPRKSARPS